MDKKMTFKECIYMYLLLSSTTSLIRISTLKHDIALLISGIL